MKSKFSPTFLLSLVIVAIISWSNYYQQRQSNYISRLTSLSPKEVSRIYKMSGLNGRISYDAFKKACHGFSQLPYKSNIITIIDFSLPSNKKRFAVIDLVKAKILYHTYTTHGSNTGGLYATKFSNKNGSHQSSLGFFQTGAIYNGKWGYSIRLHGLETGINDQAFKRAIVIHPADYVTEDFIRQYGKAGLSWGCPALPPKLTRPIINTIKGGTYIFAYAKQDSYLKKSMLLK